MKHVKINPLLVAVICLVWHFGQLENFLVTYLSLVVHELCHILFLCRNKLLIRQIVLEPFGICIQTENNPPESAMVYLSAPFFNLFLAGGIFGMHHYCGIPFYSNWFFPNLLLGIFNLLPILPLDGGRALLCCLRKQGMNAQKEEFIRFLSVSGATAVLAAGLWLLWNTGYNFSLFLIGIFLLFCCLCRNELTVCRQSTQLPKRHNNGTFDGSMPVSYIGASWNMPAHKLIQSFQGDHYYIVNVIKNGIVLKTVTETQLIEKILSSNRALLLQDC